jgi:tetratricopeptide (TPR) repeat protein
MYRLAVSLAILLILAPGELYSQENVKIKKSDFRGDKAGFRQAWEHVLAGDAFYSQKGANYNRAYDHYIQAIAYNNSSAELNYKTGISAIYTNRKEEAAGFFLKALELNSNVAPDLLLYTGRALQYSGNFKDAINKLSAYIKSPVTKSEEELKRATKFIDECKSAIRLIKDTIPAEITNLGQNINSGSDDFAPVFSWDGMTLYFASQKKTGKNTAGVTSPDENIFYSRSIGGAWGVAVPAGENLTTDYNESPLWIDSSETRMFIYSGFENGGDIRMAETRKGDWKSPVDIPYSINTSYSEVSIAFSLKGDEVYFISNNPKENLGGYDIFFIKKTGEKKWSKPQNLGPAVNTLYDEQAVSLSAAADTLWFSSKGHDSMGGYDIFYSTRNENGSWSEAVNAGFPVNTIWDEIFYTPTHSGDNSFCFSSNRSGGFGGLDIYKARLLPLRILQPSDK